MDAVEPGGSGVQEAAADEAAVAESSSKYLTAADILNAEDLNEADVEIPEWGGTVKVRALTKGRQQAVRKASQPGGKFDPELFEIALFVEGVIEPQFDASQLEALKNKAAGPIDRVTKKVMELSGMTEDSVDEAEAQFRNDPSA